MKNAQEVAELIRKGKEAGKDLQRLAWDAALSCVGWAYVFGARGQYCTPANRRARYSADHPTIKTDCKNFSGSGSAGCGGCKWYPEEKYTRVFDCRGLTYWILLQVYGWELMGAGATSQWSTEKNWKEKGAVADGIPKDTLVCLFVKKGKKMEHTGFGFNGETVECSAGVQHFTKMKDKWTDWGVPACIEGDIPDPQPVPVKLPTLRKGSKGKYVTLAQTELMNKGYSLAPYGADGSFGAVTEKAVKQFQKDWGLEPDGVIGEKTWEMLQSALDRKTWTVTIRRMNKSDAEALVGKYQNASMAEESGKS